MGQSSYERLKAMIQKLEKAGKADTEVMRRLRKKLEEWEGPGGAAESMVKKLQKRNKILSKLRGNQ
jgi:hypothetical protein